MVKNTMVKISDENLIWENDNNLKVDREYERAGDAYVKTGKIYVDEDFKLSDDQDNYGNTIKQILHVLNELNEGKKFVEQARPQDIAQGEAGDCWFLSSLCSFVNNGVKISKLVCDDYRSRYQALVKHVLNIEENQNSNNGCYKFNFFKMGEWQSVIVDDQLPLKLFKKTSVIDKKGEHRGITFDPDDVEEYWALLLTKVQS